MSSLGFVQSLFSGTLAEERLFPFPIPSEPEAERLRELLNAIDTELHPLLDAAVVDRARRLPEPALEWLRARGLFGLGVPARYGGQGLSASGSARVIDHLAGMVPALAYLLTAHEALCAQSILEFGSEDQKERYLPRICRGEMIGAFALTEALTGSDAGRMRTLAEYDEGDGAYVLNGEKSWVTNGDRAGLMIVFARTNRANEGEKPRIVALLVEPGAGITVGEPLELHGVRALGVSTVRFENVRVLKNQVLGARGRGFRIAVDALDRARVMLSAGLVGQCRVLINLSVERLTKRRSFGRTIGEFPIMKDKLGTMMAHTFGAESLSYFAAGVGFGSRLESALSRLAASEALGEVANGAAHIAAGAGFVAGHPVERALRDARAGFLMDSTNEMLRSYVALIGVQGAARAAGMDPSAAGSNDAGPLGRRLQTLKGAALERVRDLLRHTSLTRADPLLAESRAVFDRAEERFARSVMRVISRHGSELPELQNMQRRLTDIALDLTLLGACISRTSEEIARRGPSGAKRHRDLTELVAHLAKGRLETNLNELEHNDDELRRRVASRTYTDGVYPMDVI